MNYKSFNLGDWIGHISGVIEDESELDGNEMRDLVEFLSGLPKWIPISERLPEYPGVYMTTLDYGKHGLATGARYYHGKYFKWMNECVIAWMPLPEPYKAESERLG